MQTVSGPILIQRPVCLPDLQTKTSEDTNWMKKLEMDYAPRKIALPEGMEAQEPFAIQKHHLDTHHHVNNCQYIRMGADYLPEGFEIRQMRAEYKKQALLGDVFYPAVKLEMGKGYGCAFHGEWRTLCDCRVYVCMR